MGVGATQKAYVYHYYGVQPSLTMGDIIKTDIGILRDDTLLLSVMVFRYETIMDCCGWC